MKTYALKLTLWLLLFVSSLFQALQAQNRIAGTVQDVAHNPLAFASVTLLNAADSTLIRGLVADEQGIYSFEIVPAGAYVLAFSMLGFGQNFTKTIVLEGKPGGIDLDPVILDETSAALEEALVVAKRPFLEQKIDRTVVNVANSITKSGGNALEVLQRSPGVQVNNLTKSIALLGKEGVVVMINGKIARQPADAIVQMLQGMNAANIDRIELIHTPPANFEAEGNAGIINIVLKSTGDEGLNGGYSAKAGYGKGAKYGAGLHFNYRNVKVNWFGNYDYDFNLNPQVFTNYRGLQQGNDFLETETRSNRPHTPTSVQNARLGVDFQLSFKTVLGVLGTFFDRNWYKEAANDVTYSKNGAIDSRLRMPNTETNHHQSFTGNINLTHQLSKNQSLNLDADYIRYDIDNPSHYDVGTFDAGGTPVAQYELRIGKKTPIRMAVGKADYAINIGENLKLETGGKFTSMRFDNDVCVESREQLQDWTAIPELTSLFHLNEDVLGVYATFSMKAGAKTDIKGGLRFEYTRTNLGSAEQPNAVDRKYGSWFPGLYITRKLTETQSLNFSYSRRISEISRDAMARMRDTVWAIDARKDKLENLIDRMREHAEETLTPRNIRFAIEAEHLNGKQNLATNIRQNLYLIYKEAVTNIAKHSNGDAVSISLKKSGAAFEMRICDNGTVEEKTYKTTGQGTANMRMRAEKIGGTLEISRVNGFCVILRIKSLE